MPTVNLSMFAGAGAQFLDNAGNVLTGGKIYSYAAGTTTPEVVYTTSAGDIAHSNPLILDASGRVPSGGEIWLSDAIQYKFILNNANDVLIATYDDITGNGSGVTINLANTTDPTKGDALVGYRQSNSSGNLAGAVGKTVHQKFQEFVSIKDFGAVGDGIVDDTAAIQTALDYVIGQENLGLIVPGGTFLINGTVSINKLSGDRTPTYIFGGGTLKKTNAGVMFNATNNATSEIFFNNIYFLASLNVNVVAFECNQEFIRGYFYNCTFENFDVCFDSTGYLMQSFRISGCDFSQIKSWVIDCGTTGGFPTGSANDVHISQCQIEGQNGGVFRGSTGSVTVSQCVIENLVSQPAFYITNSGSLSIINNYFEDCASGVVICAPLSNCAGITAQSNYVGLAAGTKFIVWGKMLAACLTIGNTVNTGQTNDTSQVTNGFVATFNDVNIGGVPDGTVTRAVVTKTPGSTFTPVVVGNATTGTCTYTVQDGNYSQIGNVINFQLNVGWTGHTGTGSLVIVGLPPQAISKVFVVSAIPNGITLPAGSVLSAIISAGNILLTSTPTDGLTGTYANLDLGTYTAGNVYISGSYITT